jgi:hypothetical protein
MNISLINLNPASVLSTTYDPFISLIDLTQQVITIRKGSNTSGQALMNNQIITINKEYDTAPVQITVRIT